MYAPLLALVSFTRFKLFLSFFVRNSEHRLIEKTLKRGISIIGNMVGRGRSHPGHSSFGSGYRGSYTRHGTEGSVAKGGGHHAIDHEPKRSLWRYFIPSRAAEGGELASEPRYEPDQSQCERHLRNYEESVRKSGQDSMGSTLERNFLINKCGAYFQLGERTTLPEQWWSFDSNLLQCGVHLHNYEELVRKDGRDCFQSTTMRILLINVCGDYFHPDEPSSLTRIHRHADEPSQDTCRAQLERYAESVRKDGRNCSFSITMRTFLTDYCGGYFDPDEALKSLPQKLA